jgi:hypothetical protein
MTLEQATQARLMEIRAIAETGQTHRTGKTHRVKHESGEETRSRRFGGMSSSYPELSRAGVSPSVAAKAIARGKGKVYNRLKLATERQLEPYFKRARKRYPEKPTVAAHPRKTAKCKSCGVAHGKGVHRFHGEGAFHRTHMFAFNPGQTRRGRMRRNPYDPRLVEIYGRLLRIEAQKTQAHACDPDCAKVEHKYYHPFKPGAHIFGVDEPGMYKLDKGDLIIKNRR